MTEQPIFCRNLLAFLRSAKVVDEVKNLFAMVFLFHPNCLQVVIVEGEEGSQVDLKLFMFEIYNQQILQLLPPLSRK